MNSSQVLDPSPNTSDHVDRAAYPFASRWANLPAGRMHYVDEGKGDTLLFVHGTPNWSFEWRHLIRSFSFTHRCIAPIISDSDCPTALRALRTRPKLMLN